METYGTIGKTCNTHPASNPWHMMKQCFKICTSYGCCRWLRTWQDGATLQQSCNLLSMLWLKARFPVFLRTLYLCLQTDIQLGRSTRQTPEDRIKHIMTTHLRSLENCHRLWTNCGLLKSFINVKARLKSQAVLPPWFLLPPIMPWTEICFDDENGFEDESSWYLIYTYIFFFHIHIFVHNNWYLFIITSSSFYNILHLQLACWFSAGEMWLDLWNEMWPIKISAGSW